MRKAWMLLNQEDFVFYAIIIASVLLSCWLNQQAVIINPDGICYLLSAKTYEFAGIKEAMSLCGQSRWPFYSLLIHIVTRISSLPYETAAHVINGCFTLMTTVLFVVIVKALGASRRVLWLAAVVILCAHQFNTLRPDIIRDHGFWAFYLLSLYILLKFVHQPGRGLALAWNACMLIATLFRLEGIFFLFLVPLSMLMYSQYPFAQRMKFVFSLSVLSVGAVAVVAIGLLLTQDQGLFPSSRLPELFFQAKNGFLIGIKRTLVVERAVSKYIIGPHSNDIRIVTFLFIVSWYITNILLGLSLGYIMLLVYAWRQRLLTNLNVTGDRIGIIKNRNHENVRVLLTYICINAFLTFVFFVENLFLSSRYLIALSLIFMLWIPFALDDLIKKSANSPRHRLLLIISSILIILSATGIVVDFGERKAFITEAGQWLGQNVPKDARIYTNNQRLMYYSQHFDRNLFVRYNQFNAMDIIRNQRWQHFDYLAFRINHKKPEVHDVIRQIPLLPTQVFSNKYGDRVVIYKVKT